MCACNMSSTEEGLPCQVDEIPLSRPKRNIARDFSDGGMRVRPRHSAAGRGQAL
jgi:hypothetical protein